MIVRGRWVMRRVAAKITKAPAEIHESAQTLEEGVEGIARAVEETRKLEAATVAPATP